MKKFYTLTAILAMSLFASAQRDAGNMSSVKLSMPKMFGGSNSSNKTMAATDTMFNNFASWTGAQCPWAPNTGPSTAGGYYYGTNQLGDKEEVQGFKLTGSTKVVGALMWFGGGHGFSTSSFIVKLYKIDNALTPNEPSIVVATKTVPFNTVDTGTTFASSGVNYFQFTNSEYINSDFGIGFDMTQLSSTDSIGLVCSKTGDILNQDFQWIKWSDDSWNTVVSSWGTGNVDVELAIWAVVDNSTASIEEEGFVNGLKLHQNVPNPFNGESIVKYELANSSNNVAIEIYDVKGRLVDSFSEGSKPAGVNSIKLNAGNYSKGTYFISLKADGRRVTEKLIVE